MSLLASSPSARANPSSDFLERITATLNIRAVITATTFVFLVACSFFRASTLPEGDIFWGARNGWETLTATGLNLTQPDTWNVVTLGERWSPNSWLWNVLLAVFYHGFGNYGFFLLTLMTCLGTSLLLWAYLRRLGMTPLTTFLVLVGCWFTVMVPYMNGRATSSDFLMLMAFLYASHRLRSRQVLLLCSAFLLSVLWVNLHLSGVIAVALFPMVTYAVLHEEENRRRFGITAQTFLATSAGVLMTPYGIDAFKQAMDVNSASSGMIVEWSSVFTSPQSSFGTILLILASVPVLVALFKRKFFLYGLAVLGLALVTANTIRFAPYLLTAVLGSFAFFRYDSESPAPVQRVKKSKVYVTTALYAFTVGLSLLAVTAGVRVAANPESMFTLPPSDFNAIPHGAVVASSQNAGSEMILYRPDVLVTLDGRNDLMGRTRFLESSNILFSEDKGEVAAWLASHRVTTVFIGVYEPGAAAMEGTMVKQGWAEERSGESILFLAPKY